MLLTKRNLTTAIASILGENHQSSLPMGKQLTEAAATLFQNSEVGSERALLIRDAKKQLDSNGAIDYDNKQVNSNEPLAATALYNDKNNYQSDYSGTRSQVIKNFVEEMEQRGAKWGRLFNQNNGELVYTYNTKIDESQIRYFITNENIIHAVFPDNTSSLNRELRISESTITVMSGTDSDSYEEDSYTLYPSLTSLALVIEGN